MKLKKITASLAAALMSMTIIGAAEAYAVEYIGSPSLPSSVTSDNTTVAGVITGLSNVTAEYYGDCIRVGWKKLDGTANYVVQIFSEKGQSISFKAINPEYDYCTLGYADFGVEPYDTQKFYISVWALPPKAYFTADIYKSPCKDSPTVTVSGNMSKFPKFGTVKNVKCTCIGSELVVTWENPAAIPKTDTIFSLNVVEKSSGKCVAQTSTTDLTAKFKGLKNKTDYQVKIYNEKYSVNTVTDVTFYSTKDAESSAVETDPSKLSAPASVTAKGGDKEIVLTWSKVTGADAYKVYKYDPKTGKYKACKTVKGTKCTVSGLKSGTTYKFRVAPMVINPATGKYITGPSSLTVSAKPKSKK